MQVYIVVGGLKTQQKGSYETFVKGESTEWTLHEGADYDKPGATGNLRGITINNIFYVVGGWNAPEPNSDLICRFNQDFLPRWSCDWKMKTGRRRPGLAAVKYSEISANCN